MKKNVLLIPFVAVLTLLVFSMASAIVDNDNIVDGSLITEFNGVILGSNTMTGDVDGMVPVRVTFTANDTVSDVRVEVSMDGFRDDVDAETSRFSIVAGKTYTKLLSLKLPSDVDEQNEDYTLKVELTHDGSNAFEEYTISMQRTDYTFEVLSVDYNSRVEAGDVFPVSVVVKNTGYNRMDDTYVVVSIPALGVSARGYVGDLVPTNEDLDNDDKEDSMSKVVALKVPADVATGVYEMEVVVYNDDARTITGNLIAIDGIESDTDDAPEVLDADDNSSVSTPVVALTVILVIVFVVLLAVLVILLTKKGKSSDEVETSYY